MNEAIIKIGVWYVEQFEQDNKMFIEYIIKSNPIRKIMISVYRALVSEKRLPKIEDIGGEEKINFWNDAKEFAAGRLSNEGCIELAKTLFVLKYL